MHAYKLLANNYHGLSLLIMCLKAIHACIDPIFIICLLAIN